MAHQPAHWPHHPDEDDPPVGLTIRPLHQLPDLADLSESTPKFPAPAPSADWERGGVYGTPGGSAMAHYQLARAREWATFARTLPLRLAAVIAAGAQAGTFTHGAGPRLAGPAAALVAGGDHLLIGPPGVFLIDSKAWHGSITLAVDGSAWHNGHPLEQTLATVSWEAQQLADMIGAPVLPLLCVHDTRIPWDEIYIDSVPMLTPTKLLALLRSLPTHMDEVGVMLLAEHARHHLHRAT
jgi:hypothetical protein